ncbi:DUF4135 domain-containing protein [Streptomyces alboflavus]|uniref:DUF4135 domain-containing protein n=1 Tax=Streptomyces alboflavus TaxID=67267 RepID=UPI00193AE146|nr:DUF4135 domain-containing protein [Streptomyces alboflavus]
MLSAYWDRILAGFREMTAHLHRPGTDPHRLLRRFEGTRARRILRPTQAYVDIGRMLWHPASLHDETAAVERARDILRRTPTCCPARRRTARPSPPRSPTCWSGTCRCSASPWTRPPSVPPSRTGAAPISPSRSR